MMMLTIQMVVFFIDGDKIYVMSEVFTCICVQKLLLIFSCNKNNIVAAFVSRKACLLGLRF